MTEREEAFYVNLKKEMHAAADGCVVSSDFGAHFLPHWFWNISQPYAFLFKKNLNVTNIQVAELLSLVSSHSTCTNDSSGIRFASIPDFNKQISRFMETFRPESDTEKHKVAEELNDSIDRLLECYKGYFADLSLVDLYQGSCVISIPPLVDIDLESICFLSGYIHSCGPCIYLRDIYHSRYPTFLEHLKGYLKKLGDHEKLSKPILFRTYAHEDFTDDDRSQKDDLASGLDELKVYSTKQHMGRYPIASVIEKLRDDSDLRTLISVPKQGSAKYYDTQLSADGVIDKSRTIWLIMDRPFDQNPTYTTTSRGQAGNQHFLLCYDQLWKNDNPFHLFDENKPGWYDHTTIPHTLMGAMINITRPFWPKRTNGTPLRLFDPFSGSGTTLLESAKFTEVEFHGADIVEISPIVTEDNIAFFSLSPDDLVDIHSHFSKLISYIQDTPTEIHKIDEWDRSEAKRQFEWAEQLLSGVLSRCGNDLPGVDPTAITEIQNPKSTLLGRVFFYALLKVQRRYSYALQTNQISKKRVRQKELSDFLEQLSRLISIRKQMKAADAPAGESRLTYLGDYSRACSLSPAWLRGKRSGQQVGISRVQDIDVTDYYDVIITDPPYGFNTFENIEELQTVYSEGLPKIMRALAPDGQLVIALPDWSHTGRRIPAFAFKEFVAHNVIRTAEKLHREAYQASTQVPRLGMRGSPPYYWESQRALRRAILHFRFREIKTI